VSEHEADGLVATALSAIMNSSWDQPRSFSITASRFHGWSGTPALGVRTKLGVPVLLTRTHQAETTDSGSRASITIRDDGEQAEVIFHYDLAPSGILSAWVEVRATGVDVLEVTAARLVMPLPLRAGEILDFSGGWAGERRPQRRAVADGTWRRATHRGRPGHDAAYVSAVGTPGFGFRHGEVWAAHLAWSGNQEYFIERLPEGAGTHTGVLGIGEVLEPGEISLAPGETYRSPTALFAWSDHGLDGLSAHFHEWVRATPAYPRSPRPLLLNTWEAAYFDHDPAHLHRLADLAATIGVERFVLDDGWFEGRRHDQAGLGDWYVDTTVWPDGLRPLSDHVHSVGMQLGLWFEPEMANPDSNLVRAHPDWLLAEDPRLAFRHQFALDLAVPAAYVYILERISTIVEEVRVDFIKWDHNRDVYAGLSRTTGHPRSHDNVRLLYQLMDELRTRFPHLEIESCASGGGRIDLGITQHVQRVWASDTNDPVERQNIQLWTGLLLPPELIGSHVGMSEAHTTHRVTALSFRLITALFGHAGIEWDITRCAEDEITQLARWAALYKELRPLLHSGVTVRSDWVDKGALLHGVVSPDGRHALFAWVRLETSGTLHTSRVALPGLDPSRYYRVRVREEVGEASRHEVSDPPWFAGLGRHGVVLPGSLLGNEGVPLPLLNPANALLLELQAL
jgi:alpha-galactosidase